MAGHPVHTFLLENEAIQKVKQEIEARLPRLDAKNEAQWEEINRALQALSEIKKHYLRKENQLFPYLEKHGITGPSNVMWSHHDEIRTMLKKAFENVKTKDGEATRSGINALLQAVGDMIYKEEKILFPMALDTLNEAEWQEVKNGGVEIGYTIITPGDAWAPVETIKHTPEAQNGESIKLDTGYLTTEQINMALNNLPVEITFVDENGKVLYYSQGKERIFPRSPGIIGRTVQNCHPPSSVDEVNKVIASLKNGEEDEVDFWLQLGEKFIHIRYFAIRDHKNNFKGIMEVSQDITKIRKLEGEKRLKTARVT